MPIKLDERAVKDTRAPATGAITLWDDKETGFGLRIFAPTSRHPEGARSFFINYRINGVERRLTVGAYPRWSALAARNEAKALRKRIDKGEDPALARREAREAPTIKDLAERYKAEHLPSKAKQSQANDWAMITNEILPVLGGRAVAGMHYGDIKKLHEAITARGAPVRANRVFGGRLENVRPLVVADGGRG